MTWKLASCAKKCCMPENRGENFCRKFDLSSHNGVFWSQNPTTQDRPTMAMCRHVHSTSKKPPKPSRNEDITTIGIDLSQNLAMEAEVWVGFLILSRWIVKTMVFFSCKSIGRFLLGICFWEVVFLQSVVQIYGNFDSFPLMWQDQRQKMTTMQTHVTLLLSRMASTRHKVLL